MNRILNIKTVLDKIKAGLPANTVVALHSLRADVDLIDGNGTYDFDFRKAKGNQKATEILLNENDAFVAVGVRFGLAVRDTTLECVHVVQSYPNKIIFEDETTATPSGTFNPDHLEAIYNAGFLSYKKGDTTWIPRLSLDNSRFVGQTQQSSAANKSSTEFFESGVQPLEQPLKFQGTDLGELKLNIPAASLLKLQYTTAAHSGKKVIAVCKLFGVLISGGNKIATGAALDVFKM